MRALLIISLLSISSLSYAGNYICAKDGSLLNIQTGRTLKEFSTQSSCQYTTENAHEGFYCTNSGEMRKLNSRFYSLKADKLKSISGLSCTEILQNAKGTNYCDITGGIRSLNSLRAVNQMSTREKCLKVLDLSISISSSEE